MNGLVQSEERVVKRNPVRQLVRRLLRKPDWDAARAVQTTDPAEYLAAYAASTDLHARIDPKVAVGGHWEEIGGLQFGFLVLHGLKPHHRLLDVGCGSLRAGRWLVRYLEPGNYTGIDISPVALHEAKRVIRNERLADRNPRLMLGSGRLTFEEFSGQTFDFVLAQSVFTHLTDNLIEECFQHVKKVMTPETAFYFTAWTDSEKESTQPMPFDFRQTANHFQGLAEKYSYHLTNMSAEYPHPREQRMFRAQRSS